MCHADLFNCDLVNIHVAVLAGTNVFIIAEARWSSGRAPDSGARGQGFDPQSERRVLSLSKIHLPPEKVLVIPRKWWLRPDMTEKLLTET